MKDSLPEELYVAALMQDLEQHLPLIQNRPIVSIFFGGGTPSLFSPAMIARILEGADRFLSLSSQTEITLEANPGTIDQVRFKHFRAANINRLSLGIQSLQDDKLKTLGRIHDSEQALRAIEIARDAGFDNFNLDLMFGLPHQSMDDALYDLSTALSCKPTHLSWYQLTIEPNTVFYKHTPPLPPDDFIYEMQLKGQALLAEHGFKQYEVSAYAKDKKECLHNRNYWEFGDYLGIGAGAHSKITDSASKQIIRFAQMRQPSDYMNKMKRRDVQAVTLSESDLIFEFMLNALRLTDGVSVGLFSERTGLSVEMISAGILAAKKRGLLEMNDERIVASGLGKSFLNDLVAMFMPAN